MTILLTAFYLMGYSQEGYSIKGTVYDMETSETLLFATISIYQDDKLITGTITDFEGEYRIENLASETYKVEVSYCGYEPYVFIVDLSIFNQSEENILMIPVSNLIDIVEIVSYKICRGYCCCCCCVMCSQLCFVDEKSDGIDINENLLSKAKSQKESLVYPNPAIERTRVKIDDGVEWLRIYNSNGALQRTLKVDSGETNLDLMSWMPGMYIINFIGEDKILSTDRLIVVN